MRIVRSEVEVSDDASKFVLADRRRRRRITVGDTDSDVIGVVADAEDDGMPSAVVEAGADGLFDPEVADGQGEDEATVAAQEESDLVETFAAAGLTEKFTW